MFCKFVYGISYFKNNSDRYYHTCTLVLMFSTRYFCRVLISAEFSRHILTNYIKQI
jgi:hypothetical protein